MSIGTEIKARRQKLGLTQTELAARMDPPAGQGHIAEWERDRVIPDVATLRRLAKAMECKVGRFLR